MLITEQLRWVRHWHYTYHGTTQMSKTTSWNSLGGQDNDNVHNLGQLRWVQQRHLLPQDVSGIVTRCHELETIDPFYEHTIPWPVIGRQLQKQPNKNRKIGQLGRVRQRHASDGISQTSKTATQCLLWDYSDRHVNRIPWAGKTTTLFVHFVLFCLFVCLLCFVVWLD